MIWWKLVNRLTVPCTLEEWADEMRHPSSRIVKQETIGRFFVSTVFLGIDHGMAIGIDGQVLRGDPLLFESMVFHDDASDHYTYMTRCSTWNQAEGMHKKAVAWVEAKIAAEISNDTEGR